MERRNFLKSAGMAAAAGALKRACKLLGIYYAASSVTVSS